MWSLPKPPSGEGEVGIAYPVLTEEIEKQQHIRTFMSFSSIEEFPESTNPFRQGSSTPLVSSPSANEDDARTNTAVNATIETTPSSLLRLNASGSPSQWDSINTDEGDARSETVVNQSNKPTPSSPPANEGNDRTNTAVNATVETTPSSPLRLNASGSLSQWDSIDTDEGDARPTTVVNQSNNPTPSFSRRLNVSGSQSQWHSINVHDNRSPSFNNRRPGGGVLDRLETSISPLTMDLDVPLRSAGRDHYDDDNISVNTPSVTTAVTENVSQVTPDDNRPVEEDRGRRSQSNNSGRARQRRYGRKTVGRRRSSDTRRLAMCGTVGMNDEIRASMRDITDSVQQIFTTVKRFGPNERDAVRETLLEAQDFIRKNIVEKCGNKLLSNSLACGIDDVIASFDLSGDGSMSPVLDSKRGGETRARRVREGDTIRPTSQRGRKSSLSDDSDDMSSTFPKVYLDAPVLYSMPIDDFVR
jgi:hypothetical protein